MSIKLATAFLDRVQRSGLVAAQEMPQLRHDLEVRGVDLDNAKAIADALVDMQVITRWQADKVLEGKHKGFFLGSYRLLRPLGRGGMGAVFLAQHEMMRRQCAIKVLPHSQIKEGSSVLKRFYVEAQAVAALDHQNIVRAYDVAMESKDGKDIHYLVMEYVEGHDLQTLVQERGVLDYVKAAEYLRQTANGLTHAHEAGLVHRDIKPANLLVDKKGMVKILDLGLARFFDDSEQASLTTAFNETVLGTADYLSPEQALNSHTVDHRTDIYSLGCTAYFLLVGTPPFPEGTVAQRLVAHQVKSPQPIKEKRSDAPKDLVAIIDKMMAKRAEDRFHTAEELATVLARWLIEYGGDDWKRQHSEITGNKALMSLLSAREPTRTIRSSMSETELELELAPLDDDDDAGAGSPSSESGSNLNLTGSGIRKTGESSASRRRTAAAEDQGDQLAGLLDGHNEGLTAGSKPADAASSSDTADSESLLPPLDDGIEAGVGPLADLGVSDLGSLGTGDLLGDLDHHDLMGVGSGEVALGAMDSHLQQVTLSSGGSSVSNSHRRNQAAPEKDGTASASIIGWPIVIGGAGGLLLVLIIMALFQMSSAPEVPQLVPGQQVAVAPQSENDRKPEVAAEPDSRPVKAVPDAGRQQPKPPSVEVPGSKPEIQVGEEPPAKEQAREVQIGLPAASERQPKAADPAEFRPSTTDQTQPGASLPDVDAQELETAAKPSDRSLVDIRDMAPATPARTLTPQEMLATIEGFRIEPKGSTSPGLKIPPQLKSYLNLMSSQAVREVTEVVGRSGSPLKVDAAEEALLILDFDLQPGYPNMLLRLRGELTVEDESGAPVQVWSHTADLAAFRADVNHRILADIIVKNTREFAQQLLKEYSAAVEEYPTP